MARIFGGLLLVLVGCAGARETELSGPYRAPAEAELEERSPRGPMDKPAKAESVPLPSGPVAPQNEPQCLGEVEDNDDDATATTFTGCIAGSIEGRDRDVLRVVAPADARHMLVSRTESGRLIFQLENGPGGYTLDAGETVKIPVDPGEAYLFQVSAFRRLEEARTYELRVTFE